MRGWHGVLATGAALVLLWSFPPFFGIDADSGGRLHQAIGRRPRWAPPGPDEVCIVLRERQLASGPAPTLDCPPSAERRAALSARVNTVHLLMESTGALLACAVWLFVARLRTGRR